ncbi:MAG: arsenite/tail-anchored protein-transporting ATPase [Candidatus Methanomethylophilaceae archaeon]|nr:arsenite/tail-anchored protein-transporting ATPase [Candidatus Methanomethylophilaceae archaeon]MDI3541610.1 arsenite/tail-anchored protein-transporting ATPase [Candidatus Methanomethylophilaceae archaeon]
MRIIIYTGKGGVGKTSVAAATAKRCAASGKRTLVMSTDSAHSLSDSLELQLDGTIRSIGDNLDAIEIDILHEMETRWKEIEKYISDFMHSQGLDTISAKELAVLPGMEFMSALFYLWEFDRDNAYDVVVLDTAPTAETLRLLSFPDVSQWYIDKLYALFKRMLRVARATVGKMMEIPLPTEGFLEDLEIIRARMISVRKLLQDNSKTTIRLVVNPERMVINETKRAYTYLCLYGMTVECLVVNRLIPDEGQEGYFKKKLEEQNGYIKIIHEAFDPMPILTAYQMPTELLGDEKLNDLADMVFGKGDPTVHFSTESPMEFLDRGDLQIMSLRLPFSTKGEVELYRKQGDVLIVQVGGHRRSITLPLVLSRSEMAGAELKDDRLLVKFKRGEVN